MDLGGNVEIEQIGRGHGVKGSRDAGSLHTPEMIPMSDFRTDKSENLRKIHAQSSAETSGLGDSLQRIHTLSSTETSGYGDTVPSPTAPTPSPDTGNPRGICSGQDAGYALGCQHYPGLGPASVHRTMAHQDGRQQGTYAGNNPTTSSKGARGNPGHTQSPKIPSSADPPPEFVSLAKGKGKHGRQRQHARHASPPPPDLRARLPDRPAGAPEFIDNTHSQRHYGSPYSERRRPSRTSDKARSGGPRPKLQRSQDLDEGIGEFDDVHMGTYSPTETPPLAQVDSQNTRRSSKDLFLGKDPKSTWLMWSQERRTSFKKRIDSLEQRQKDLERTRVSTPVRKARKESIMFVSPGLEDTHLSTGDNYLLPTVPTVSAGSNTDKAATGSTDGGAATQNPLANHVVATAPRKTRRQEQDMKVDVKLSQCQMNTLAAFWEHDVFIRSRWAGIFFSSIAFVVGLVATTNYSWSTFRYPYGYTEVYGLWQNCSSNLSSSDTGDLACSTLPWPDWQNAVIGLLIFSVAFGFLATILSICGVCTTQLPKKIYYYHSAGEIYLICALACAAALVVYPVALEVEDDSAVHNFGVGYGLGWVAAIFFLASALCMCLDDLVRAIARGLCKCCRRDDGGDTRV